MVALHKGGFDVAWDKATLLAFLHDDLIWIASGATQTEVTGFIIARHTLDEAEIITLVVAPNAQGKGLGTALLATVVDYLSLLKVSQIFLEVAQDNFSAIALYKRAGFVQIGQRRGYYNRKASPNVDALVLSFCPDYIPIVANS